MRGFRLRTKLSWTLLSLTLVPLLITTLILVHFGRTLQERKAKEYHQSVSESASLLVLTTLYEAHKEVEVLGSFLTRRISGKERLALGKSWIRETRYIHLAALYSSDGKSAHIFRAKGIASKSEPPLALSAARMEEAKRKDVFYYPVAFDSKGRNFLPFLLPVFVEVSPTDKRLYGYLWTELDLGVLNDQLGRLSLRRFQSGFEDIFLMNDKLETIAHKTEKGVSEQLGRVFLPWLSQKELRPLFDKINKDKIEERRLLYFTREGPRNGHESLVVVRPLPGIRWAVVTMQPLDEVYSDIRWTWRVALSVGVAFALLALLIGFWSSRRLTSPILKVVDAAKKVAEGDFEIQVQVKTQDEIGELALAFNKMAHDLRGFESQLVDETRIRTDLSRYLNVELVESIVSKKTSLTLGGERQKVTVIFADLVAFTPLVENHPPEFVVSILNELFTFLTEIVFRHGGVIDKFMGDCVMAVFGTPYARDDDAIRAVEAAEEMLHWLAVGNAKWKGDLGRELEMGIGINTGEVIAGNIGSQKRMEYTVIGDVVNIAARLEALARPGQILFTAETAREVHHELDVVSLGEFPIIGHRDKVQIYTLEDLT